MNIVCENDQVYLRPIELADTDLILKWRNSDSVRKYFIYQKPFTKEGHEKWLKEEVGTGKVVQMIICLKNNDQPIGSTYIRDIDYEHQKGEYGIFIGEDAARGKGVGTSVAKMMIDYAFQTLHLHRLLMRVFAENASSIACNERAGYEREGYLRDDVYVNGEFRDIILMSVINK